MYLQSLYFIRRCDCLSRCVSGLMGICLEHLLNSIFKGPYVKKIVHVLMFLVEERPFYFSADRMRW